MMYKSVILPLLSFAAVVCAAPASLDAATLLQNGEEAQALNRHFRTLKASDSCQGAHSSSLRPSPLMNCSPEQTARSLVSASPLRNVRVLPGRPPKENARDRSFVLLYHPCRARER